MAAPIQSPAKCEVRSVTRFLNAKGERPAWIHSPDFAPSDFHLFLHLKKHLAGKKFDDDDGVQEEVMTWFKGQAADICESGIQKLVPRLWTMPATMLKNKVVYRQFIHSVAFVNKRCTCFKTFVSLLFGHATYSAKRSLMWYNCSDWVYIIYDYSKDTCWEELEGFTSFPQLYCNVMKGPD